MLVLFENEKPKGRGLVIIQHVQSRYFFELEWNSKENEKLQSYSITILLSEQQLYSNYTGIFGNKANA